MSLLVFVTLSAIRPAVAGTSSMLAALTVAWLTSLRAAWTA